MDELPYWRQWVQKATILNVIANRLKELQSGAKEGSEKDGLFLIMDLIENTKNGIIMKENNCVYKDKCIFYEEDN